VVSGNNIYRRDRHMFTRIKAKAKERVPQDYIGTALEGMGYGDDPWSRAEHKFGLKARQALDILVGPPSADPNAISAAWEYVRDWTERGGVPEQTWEYVVGVMRRGK